MAAMASLATTDEGRKKIEQMIRRNLDGTYTVTFKERKTDLEIATERLSQFPPTWDVDPYKTREVTVTADFPRGSAVPDEPGEMWVPLIEKAYGRAYTSGEWESGYVTEAMERLTGVPTQRLRPDRTTMAALADHLAKGHAVAVTSLTDKNYTAWGRTWDIPDISDVHPVYTSGKIKRWHVYYVTGVDPATDTVILRNPWGWTGDQTINLTIGEFRTVFAEVAINPGK
jgi:hypothetical protein